MEFILILAILLTWISLFWHGSILVITTKCADQCLKEVIVQTNIEPFVSIRAIRELLSKVMPERKYIDKCMINDVRIHSRKKRLELENVDIEIDLKHFDTLFITTYRDTSRSIVPICVSLFKELFRLSYFIYWLKMTYVVITFISDTGLYA